MEFKYFDGEQRTKPWYDLRLGRVTASRLEDWLAVSKAKNTPGKPLKKRLDYEKELLFERQFGVAFDNFVSDQMKDGVAFERFALKQYEVISGNSVRQVGAWFNEHFVASPDGEITDVSDDTVGLAEVKVVRDNTFTDILAGEIPEKWLWQVQGQLWASGKDWCDFICINLKTRKVFWKRIKADPEFHEWLELAVPEELVTKELYDVKKTTIHDFVKLEAGDWEVPEGFYEEDAHDPEEIKELGF